MKTSIFFSLCATAGVILSGAFHATGGVVLPEETATNPVGFLAVNCLAASDTRVGVGFTQPPEFRGALSSDPAPPSGDDLTIAANGTPNWTPDEFSSGYYVRFTSGAKAGRWFDVVGNGANTLTIDLNGDTGGCAQGDTFKLIQHWTLGTLFPAGQQDTFYESTGELVFQQRSKLILPDITTPGVNLPASKIYIVKSTGWVDATGSSPFPAADNTIIDPDMSFIVRHPGGVADTVFAPLGHVETEDVVIALATNAGLQQDNALALIRPVPVTLLELGLGSNFEDSIGHLVFQRRDQLFAFDNAVAALNKPASKIFYRVSGTWFRDDGLGASNPVADNEQLPGSSAIIVRKAVGDGTTKFWTNTPNY